MFRIHELAHRGLCCFKTGRGRGGIHELAHRGLWCFITGRRGGDR